MRFGLALAFATSGCGRIGGDGGRTEGVGGSAAGVGGSLGAGGAVSGVGGAIGEGGAGSGIGGSGIDGGMGNDAGSADAQPPGPATRAFVPTVSTVRSIVISNGVIYVGGFFSSSTSTLFPAGVAALDETTLSNMPAWAPQVFPFVNSLAVSDGLVYAGLDIGNGDLQALDAVTGMSRSSLPHGDAAVIAVAVGGGTLYVGGIFMTIGGTTRNQFAAVDATTGALKSWAPNDTYVPGWPMALAISGNTVYAGGTFTLSNGSNGTRGLLAAMDATTGALTQWNPLPNGSVSALLVVGNQLFVGGGFLRIAGQPRNSVAAFDLTTGELLPWAPVVATGNGGPSSVQSLAVQGNIVYLGGRFTQVAGQPRGGLAAVDATSGAVLPWAPMTSPNNAEATAVVSALAASDKVVVAGINGSVAVTGVAFYPPASP